MSEKEVIEQLESLIDDRNSFIDPLDKDENNIFRKDKRALKQAIELINKYIILNKKFEQAKIDGRGLANWQWCVVVGSMEEEMNEQAEQIKLKDKVIDKLKFFQCNAKCMNRYKLDIGENKE